MLFLKKLFAKDGIDLREPTYPAFKSFDDAKHKVYPWIKVTYPFTRENSRASVSQIFQGENMPVFQFWMDDLCIFYAVERHGRHEFLLQKDVPKGVTMESLHHMATRNLDRDITFELGNAHFGGYALIAGGDHESAAICLPHVWEWICGELQDNLIIGLPAKDQVFIVPERDVNNVANLKIMIHEYFRKGDKLLTRNIFRLNRATQAWSIEDTIR